MQKEIRDRVESIVSAVKIKIKSNGFCCKSDLEIKDGGTVEKQSNQRDGFSVKIKVQEIREMGSMLLPW